MQSYYTNIFFFLTFRSESMMVLLNLQEIDDWKEKKEKMLRLFYKVFQISLFLFLQNKILLVSQQQKSILYVAYARSLRLRAIPAHHFFKFAGFHQNIILFFFFCLMCNLILKMPVLLGYEFQFFSNFGHFKVLFDFNFGLIQLIVLPTISPYTSWKFFGQLNRLPNVPQNIY